MDGGWERFEALGIEAESTRKRFCGDADLLVSMLHEFADEDLLEKLPAALGSRDFAVVERVSHAVKGTSANLGFKDLSLACDQVVQAVRAGRTDEVDGLSADALGRYRAIRAGIASL